jgi:hypothetical protein
MQRNGCRMSQPRETMPITRATRMLSSLISDVLGPLPVCAAMFNSATQGGRGWLSALGWTLLGITFAGIIPYLLTWRLHHPKDGSLQPKGSRSRSMLLAAVAAAIGFVVLLSLGAPDQLLVTSGSIIATLVVIAWTNAHWRWSNHVAASAAGTAILIVEASPAAGALGIIVTYAVALARVSLHRHSWSECLWGAAAGATTAAVMEILLSKV